MYAIIFITLLAVSGLEAEFCDGHTMITRGVNDQSTKDEIVNIHNQYRKEITDGTVEGQPQGINLLNMSWSDELSTLSEQVSDQCEMIHIHQRYNGSEVGQNLYMSYSSANDTEQDWKSAIQAWFDEHNYFEYPNTSLNGTDTGHYTQVVWHSTTEVGCDFIYYYDETNKKAPFTKLYTCDYLPSGNYGDLAPYETASD